MSATGPRAVKVVLADALTELRAREQRLAGALDEARAAIRALEAVAGGATPAPAVQREVVPRDETDGVPVVLVRDSGAPPVTRRDREALVLRIVGEQQPVALGVVARLSGLTLSIAKAALNGLREAGQVQRLGERAGARYWLTADLDRRMGEDTGLLPVVNS